MRIPILYTDKFLEHITGPACPECPERLEVIMRELRRSGLLETGDYELLEPRKARVSEVELVHDRKYVDWIREVCARGGGLVGVYETVVCPSSFEAALYAAGASIQAAEWVAKGRFKRAVALVRPPGHHAGRSHARGYCVFNNMAIATKHIVEKLGVKRAAIIDIDAHHGDGTQGFFYDTDRVLYASLHQDPTIFPGRGFEDEVGFGEGRGFNLNIPLPFLTGDDIYLRALETIVEPVVEQYRPELILVSLGCDTHYADPVGRLSLSMVGHVRAFSRIVKLSERTCEGKMAVILEGGYSLARVGKMIVADIALLSGREHEVVDRETKTALRVREKAEKVLKKVRKIQSEFWEL